MNRQEAEDYVYSSYLKAEKHWDYNAKDSVKRRPDLTYELLRSKSVTSSVVVTGSKGKGSVANMISCLLQAGHKVGLMTSPHITDFNDRFRIDGLKISDEDFAEYMNLIKPELDEIEKTLPEDVCISPIGIQADLALTYFNDRGTDFNVIECGKGAEFDDANNIRHEYAVINSIFLEHTRELGKTVEEIARDKAHVITGEQKCVYVAPQVPEVMKVIRSRADGYSVPLKEYGKDFKAENIRYSRGGMTFDVTLGERIFCDITITLLGEHQARNCALAMAASLDILGDLDEETARRQLKKLDYPGRMEVISRNPFMILDACINSASCQNVIDVLGNYGINKATMIIGIPDDKDYAGVAKMMQAVADTVIITKSGNPHYVFSPAMQCEELGKEGIKAIPTESVKEAIEKAKAIGMPTVILGTTSVVSEVTKLKAFI